MTDMSLPQTLIIGHLWQSIAIAATLAAALVIVAGALLGEAVFRWLGLPRIVGYSGVGLLIAGLGRGLPVL